MNKARCLNSLAVLLLLILLTTGGSACVGQPEVESRAWIDFPLEDSEIFIGIPVPITSHLYAKDGVKEFSISINGEAIIQGPPINPEETFIEISQEWVPEQPGQHTIEAAIYDANGIVSSKAQVDVTVIGEIASPQPDYTPSPSPSPSPSSSPLPEGTLAPTSTLKPLPTLSPTLTSPPPTAAPTITPDTTPPNISNMQASVDPIVEAPCQPDSVAISAQVSDASGLSEVKLYCRVVKGGQNGTWQTLPMSAGGGNQYQVTVGPNQLKASMNPYGGSILQYYVKAWDNKGNVAQSSSGNVHIQVCVQ
jgi:hypothetical protein